MFFRGILWLHSISASTPDCHFGKTGSIPVEAVSTLLFWRNLKRNEESFLIKISKEIAKKLNEKYGVRYKENGISKTHTKHATYYLCESEYNLRSLLEIASNEDARKALDVIECRSKRRK